MCISCAWHGPDLYFSPETELGVVAEGSW